MFIWGLIGFGAAVVVSYAANVYISSRKAAANLKRELLNAETHRKVVPPTAAQAHAETAIAKAAGLHLTAFGEAVYGAEPLKSEFSYADVLRAHDAWAADSRVSLEERSQLLKAFDITRDLSQLPQARYREFLDAIPKLPKHRTHLEVRRMHAQLKTKVSHAAAQKVREQFGVGEGLEPLTVRDYGAFYEACERAYESTPKPKHRYEDCYNRFVRWRDMVPESATFERLREELFKHFGIAEVNQLKPEQFDAFYDALQTMICVSNEPAEHRRRVE